MGGREANVPKKHAEHLGRYHEDRGLADKAPARAPSFLSTYKGLAAGVVPRVVPPAHPQAPTRPASPEGNTATHPGPPTEGDLGPYQLLELLGEGGMGRVYKARHRWLQRIVALKIIREEFAGDGEAIGRYRREVEAMGRLSHPNVVHALEAGLEGGRHFLVMEYVDGMDLRRVVQERGPLPVALACDCVRQAALGLMHLQEHGLAHRDIKPTNLLLTRDEVIKVADFGLARLHESARPTRTLTKDGSLLGTPDFLAPEQATSPHLAGIHADIYSLGCTFYYLLCGHVPFPRGSYLDKIVQHCEAEPDPIERHRSGVPLAVCQILRKMMAKKPEDRYRTPAEVVEALAPFCREGARNRDRRGWSAAIIRAVASASTKTASALATSGRRPLASHLALGTGAVGLAGAMLGGLLALNPHPLGAVLPRAEGAPREPARAQVVPAPASTSTDPLQRGRGKSRAPSGKGEADSPRSEGRDQEKDVTADVRGMIDNKYYYKLSGPTGRRYFVVGKEVVLDRAVLRGDALTITLKYDVSPRGIGLLNLSGIAELEFLSEGRPARVIRITKDDQIVDFDYTGKLLVKIKDVKELQKPVESKN
jgi:serine/threonine protein kinase